MSAEAEIRALINDWSAAVRCHDLDAIRAHHADDMLLFDVPPPLQSRGIDAYMTSWDLFFRHAEKPVAFDFEQIEVTAGDDVAFATAIGHCVNIERSGEHLPLTFRLTMGLRRRNGAWEICHEHHSLPAVE